MQSGGVVVKTVLNITVQCDKCGKVFTYNPEKEDLKNKKYWEVNLGKARYGSLIDGTYVKFEICDNCLVDILTQFNNKGVLENE
jgi:ribosomal protein L28